MNKRYLAVILCFCLIFSAGHLPALSAAGKDVGFVDYFSGWMDISELPAIPATVDIDTPVDSDGVVTIAQNQSARFIVDIPKDSKYHLILEYKTVEPVMLKSTLRVRAGESECATQIFSIWRDKTKDYRRDRFGNEVVSEQERLNLFLEDYVKDQASLSKLPFVFSLKQGIQEIVLSANDIAIQLKSVKVVKSQPLPSYETYKKAIPTGKGNDFIVIEGENFSAKSDSYIRSKSAANPALNPYDYKLRKLNTLDDGAFRTAGQKVFYGFSVETAGRYNIAMRYSQNAKQGLSSYLNIEIDGKKLFDSLNSQPFAYTGADYENITLTNGKKPFEVYLEAGEHTISFEIDGTPVAQTVAQLREIMSGISATGLDIKSVAGLNSNKNRTWDLESYIPGVTERLTAYKAQLIACYNQLGSDAAALVNLKLCVNSLEKLLKQPNKLPSRLEDLSEGSGSVTQLLSDQIDTLQNQGISIERIYFYDAKTQDLPSAKTGFFGSAGNSIKRFFYSLFFAQSTVNAHDEKTLNVWINRPIQYVETLQELIDTRFTPETDIHVNLSIMASEQKLILAGAADTAPDVVLGLSSNMPYDLAVRGAVTDLSAFSDFDAFFEKDFNKQAFLPFMYNEKICGAVETQEFYVLMYRTDILEKLKLKAPDTWDDVAAMMPALRRNSMNFYLQLSGYPGTKPLYTTAPFLMQSGGSLYNEDGFKSEINSKESLKGFETLTDLYRLYSLPQNVSSFYQGFRYGQTPIGIGSFTDYVKIKNAAPEIADLWAIAHPPGTPNANGEVIRGTTATATACAIMESSTRKEDGWAFLKWWMSADVQQEFGNSLQTKYGPEYMWNSANTAAFSKLSFPEDDKKVVLEQWEQMLEIKRHPALYMVERELSNAWIDVVVGGESARIALDQSALRVDREFLRKLQEFGYADSAGNKLKDYK